MRDNLLKKKEKEIMIVQTSKPMKHRYEPRHGHLRADTASNLRKSYN